MNGYCPACRAERHLLEVRRRESHRLRGEVIELEADVLTCGACGNSVSHAERDDRILKAVYDEYRRRHGMLMPEEIMRLRERYGLSQRALARLLGWGDVTIHRYENGALQDNAHETVLRQLENPRHVLDLIERYGDRLSPRERETVREAIAGSNAHESLVEQIERQVGSRYSMNGIERGFRPLDIDRLGSVVYWFAARCDNLYKTKLAKLLWLADFAHFKRQRVSITGLAYARGPHGPVPDGFALLLGGMEEEGLISLESREAGPYPGDVVVPGDPAPMELSADVLDTLQWVMDHYGDPRAAELSNKSHLENAWSSRGSGQVISYDEADRLALLASL